MMMKAKKRVNAPSSHDGGGGPSGMSQGREERVSLLGSGNKSSPPRVTTTTPPTSGNSAIGGGGKFGGSLSFRKEKRKSSSINAKVHPDMEERVSLITNTGRNMGRPTAGLPSLRRNAGNGRKGNFGSILPPWTVSRSIKYLSLMVISACLTFLLLRKQSKAVHWEEYHNILEPDDTKESRCFEQSRNTKDERCNCPDPSKPLANTTTALWMSHHQNMVHDSKNAKEDLDIVFFGDGMIEQFGGTKALGTEVAVGMEDYFEKTFTKNGGGKFEGLALGSYGDTGPNLLWHWENGISDAKLNPKLWFIMVGGNDLFGSKCTNRFVLANILNVLKRIFESHPDSDIIIHGIMPRTDDPESTSQALGNLWNRAQDINLLVRKFTDRASHIHYVNAGMKFTVESGMKGRRHLDPELMKDGMHPTAKGMQIWGDYIEKKVTEILHGRKKWDKQRKKEADAAAAAAAAEDNNEN